MSTPTTAAEPNPTQTSPLAPQDNDSPTDLSTAVDDLLATLRAKFSTATAEMLKKMDEMSARLDGLEAVLRAQGAGGDEVGRGDVKEGFGADS